MSFKIQDVPTLAKHYRRNPDEGRHPADVALALGRESPHLRRKDEAFNSLYKSIKSARRDDFVTAFGKQLLHGIDITEASLFGSAGYVGDLIGSDTVRDWGYDGFKRNMLEAEERAPTVSLQDIKEGELAGIPAFITGTIAEVVPSVAAMFTGAGIPAGLGGLVLKMGGKKAVHKLVSKSIAKQLAKEMPKKKFTDLQLRKEIRKRYKKEVETRAAKLLGPRALGKEAAQKSARQRAIKSIEKEAKGKLFRRNFQRGTTFSGIVQNLGEIAGGFDLDDPSVTRGERLLYGGIGGVLAGVLDSLLPRAILRSLTPEAKKTFMTKAIDKYKDFAEKRPVVAAALVAPGATSVQEGLTEGAQEFIGYLANNLPNEDVPFDWGDVAHRVEEAGVKGAVGGGGIGFGFGALNAVVQSGSRKSEKARRRNEQAIKNARETYQSDTGVHMYGSHRTDDQQDDLSEPSSPKFNPADQDRKTRLNVSEAKNLVGKYIAGDLTSKEAVKFNALTLTNRDEVNNPVASVLKEGRRKRLQFLMEQVGTGDTLTGVTMEAIDILNTIDDGGSVPTEVTKKLARIARDNGIDLHQEIADKAPVLENYDQRNVEGFLTGDDKVKVEGIRESIQTSKIVEQVAFGLARKKDPLSRDARTGIDTDFGTTPAWSADSEVHAWLDAVLDGITDPKEAKKKLEEAQKDQVRRRESLEEEATQLAEEGLAKLSLNERFKGVTPEMREEVLSRSSLEGRADDDLHSQVDTPLRDKAIAYITGKSRRNPKLLL